MVLGRRVEPSVTDDLIGLQDRTALPVATPELVDLVLSQDPLLLTDVPLQEIVNIVHRVGRYWRDHEYPRRRLFERYAVELLGYSEEAAVREANWIAVILSSHWRLYDWIAAELGSRYILDEWVPREECRIRVFPKGRVLHLLAGNVPLAGVVSVLRALVTKNVSVIKPAASDPVTPTMLALSFLDVDPAHPVSQSLNVLYWPPGHALGDLVATACDAVCAWGGLDAMRWARRAGRWDTEVLCFGPKRSIGVVGADADLDHAASAVACDAVVEDQRGCFSLRQVFVESRSAEFVRSLAKSLEEFSELLPTGRPSFDVNAAVSLARLEQRCLGHPTVSADDGSWSVTCADPNDMPDHPLGRTVFVHADCSPARVAHFLSPDVQTVGVMPWSLAEDHRDEWAKRGVSRLVELGMMSIFRVGGSHDDMYPLQRLVRFVSTESPSANHGKGMTIAIDQVALLREGRFGERFAEVVP